MSTILGVTSLLPSSVRAQFKISRALRLRLKLARSSRQRQLISVTISQTNRNVLFLRRPKPSIRSSLKTKIPYSSTS